MIGLPARVGLIFFANISRPDNEASRRHPLIEFKFSDGKAARRMSRQEEIAPVSLSPWELATLVIVQPFRCSQQNLNKSGISTQYSQMISG